MGGQLGRIPGYLVFRTLCLWGVCMGGQLWEEPEYPWILSIPDTVSMRWYVWGDNSGGSREDPEYPGIPSFPDTVSVRGCVWGDNSGGSRVSRDT